MKKHYILTTLTLSFCLLLAACGNDNTADVGLNDTAAIVKLFELNETKSEQLLQVYSEYRSELQNVKQDVLVLDEKFKNKQINNQISDQSMINILAEYFRIDARRSQIKQNYLQLFEAVLSKEDVFKLYLIDDNLEYVE